MITYDPHIHVICIQFDVTNGYILKQCDCHESSPGFIHYRSPYDRETIVSTRDVVVYGIDGADYWTFFSWRSGVQDKRKLSRFLSIAGFNLAVSTSLIHAPIFAFLGSSINPTYPKNGNGRCYDRLLNSEYITLRFR
jgi:hypothetical protein